jgi:hypothetical protein
MTLHRVFTVAHAVKDQPGAVVQVYRTNHHATLRAALRCARRVSAAGYLVWIEMTGELATQ